MEGHGTRIQTPPTNLADSRLADSQLADSDRLTGAKRSDFAGRENLADSNRLTGAKRSDFAGRENLADSDRLERFNQSKSAGFTPSQGKQALRAKRRQANLRVNSTPEKWLPRRTAGSGLETTAGTAIKPQVCSAQPAPAPPHTRGPPGHAGRASITLCGEKNSRRGTRGTVSSSPCRRSQTP